MRTVRCTHRERAAAGLRRQGRLWALPTAPRAATLPLRAAHANAPCRMRAPHAREAKRAAARQPRNTRCVPHGGARILRRAYGMRRARPPQRCLSQRARRMRRARAQAAKLVAVTKACHRHSAHVKWVEGRADLTAYVATQCSSLQRVAARRNALLQRMSSCTEAALRRALVRTHACVHASPRAHANARIHTRARARAAAHTNARAPADTHARAHPHTHARARTCTRACAPAHTYARAPAHARATDSSSRAATRRR
jgi:hypothetical protein